MGISTPTLITSRFQTTDSPTLVLPASGTITLVAGRLYILFFSAKATGWSPAGTPITGQSGSWTHIRTSPIISFAIVAGWWYIPATTESASVITVTTTDTDFTSAASAIIEISTGFDRTASITQSAGSSINDSLTITTSLAAPPAADAVSVAAFVNPNRNTDTLPRAGWTELSDDVGTGVPGDPNAGSLETQFRIPAEQDADASETVNIRNWAGLHLEIRADTGVAPVFGLASIR